MTSGAPAEGRTSGSAAHTDAGRLGCRSPLVLVAAAPCALRPVGRRHGRGCRGWRHPLRRAVQGWCGAAGPGRVRTVALDKTGTLTQNRPQVVEVLSANGAGRAEILSLAAGLEAASEHPLAAAILAAAPSPPAAQGVHGIPGRTGCRRWQVGDPASYASRCRRVA